MLTFRKTDTAAPWPAWRVFAGANCLGTVVDAIDAEAGMRWRAVAPDGTRFSARSKATAAHRLRIHAAKSEGRSNA